MPNCIQFSGTPIRDSWTDMCDLWTPGIAARAPRAVRVELAQLLAAQRSVPGWHGPVTRYRSIGVDGDVHGERSAAIGARTDESDPVSGDRHRRERDVRRDVRGESRGVLARHAVQHDGAVHVLTVNIRRDLVHTDWADVDRVLRSGGR